MSKNIVSVYDTITKRYVEIEVSEKIRTYYNRTQWNIDDNNKSFYKHEIQFSALKGNINGEFENFQEFRTENDDVERRVIQNIKCEKLYSSPYPFCHEQNGSSLKSQKAYDHLQNRSVRFCPKK